MGSSRRCAVSALVECECFAGDTRAADVRGSTHLESFHLLALLYAVILNAHLLPVISSSCQTSRLSGLSTASIPSMFQI